jgi:hypothetical protein
MNARFPRLLLLLGFVGFIAGCASNGGGSREPSRFRATDGRTIEIGKASPANGGREFRNPHMEKCWIADGFTFNGYDTLYIAPVTSTAKFQEDEREPHRIATQELPRALAGMVKKHGIFTNVVISENEIKPGAKVLRLDNTITEYSKGGGAARYFAGLYGAGQPVLRVVGSTKDGSKEVFTYQMRRSGVSGGARMTGAFMTDVNIQSEDIASLVLDLTDFMAATAGKYQPR